MLVRRSATPQTMIVGQNTCYTACLERGDDYDDEIHRELGYKLEASKDIYISDLECFVSFFCSRNNIDFNFED